jgi:hypothetical protein
LADGIAKREFVAGKTKKDVIQKHKKGLEGIEKGSSGATLLSGGSSEGVYTIPSRTRFARVPGGGASG